MAGHSGSDETYIAALRALIGRGVYSAALEDSPLIELPVVVARAGGSAPPSVRAQVFITALEEAVDKELRGPDRLAAKMLFAIGDWAGKPVRDRHYEVAKLRNRHWTWDRNYRKEPLTRDLTTVLRALGRLAASPANDGQTALRDLSGAALRRMGRRRTAYPLDLSLEQLHDADLYVEARLARYHDQRRRHETHTLDDVIGLLEDGRSVLLLGEPGSGKSLTLYEVGRRCADRGLLPVPVRARDLHELMTDRASDRIGTETSSVLLVDGLDEAIEPVGGRPGVVETLAGRFTIRPRLFTSRLRDYENRLYAVLQDLDFDEVFLLRPWTVDGEFRNYLQRLVDARLVDEPRLYEAVVASERLSKLVARPLYARMLTFIGEQPASNVSDSTALYGEYLSRLANVADSAVSSERKALAVWQSAAWKVYTSGHQAGDTILMSELEDLGDDAVSRRLLDHLVDTRSVQGRELGEFLHYSFYEYLVAKEISDLLAAPAGVDVLVEMLSHDLTREIRHHLVGRLLLAPPRHLKDTLLATYQATARMPEQETRQRLVACNLVIYLLSRLVADSEEPLVDLLRDETDLFLRQAILWALCHRGSASALASFFADMDAHPAWRSECRGYVLYYYGDLPKDAGPPYRDEPPYRPCNNSHRRVIAMFQHPSFLERVPAERQAVDLYTFLDLLVVRERPISDDDATVLKNLIEMLQSRGIADTITARLREMLALLTCGT